MDDKEETQVEPALEETHKLRVGIDATIKSAQHLKGHVTTKGARELSLVITKLQEAKMWAGKILEACGSELPAEYRDEAGESDQNDKA